MKYLNVFLKYCICFCILSTVLVDKLYSQENSLKLISPELDSSTVTQSTVYLKGIVSPTNFVSVNGNPVKVYSTGVFVSQLSLKDGVNLFKIQYGQGRDTIVRTIIYNKIEGEVLKETTGFEIEYVRLLPNGKEVWLNKGDRLQVEMKASSGMKATFWNDNELTELDSSEVGVRGIYRGEYIIREEDRLWDEPILFSLYDLKSKRSIKKLSDQKISFLTNRPTLMAVTNNSRTALSYGLGEDRLGGAKMGTVDSLVKLVVTGKMGGMYRVRLSDQSQAYVTEDNLRLLKGVHFRPESLTSSWSVSTNGKNDFVSIGVGQRLPYVSTMENNPSRIVVDIFGAVSNSNWITQRTGLVAIKNVWYEQVSKDQFRAIIELQDSRHWGYEIGYKGNSLFIRVKPKPHKLRIEDLTIAVDAGHGGTNLGAIGLTGVKEKDINLAIAQFLRDNLIKKGAKVIMTRDDDSNITNPKRLDILKKEDPDLLISIHCNAAGSPFVEGTSTYYKHQGFRSLSQYIQGEMLELGLADFGNVGGFNFTLNSPTEFPSALVEVAFMSNPGDEERLLDRQFQEEVAKRIVKGIEHFLEIN